MNPIDRRDFLALWIQALLLALFPFLRERPLAARRLADELADRELIRLVASTKDCPIWNMPVIEQTRWTISSALDDAEVTRLFGGAIDL